MLILKALEFGTGFNIIMITIINIFIGGRGNGDIVPLLNGIILCAFHTS